MQNERPKGVDVVERCLGCGYNMRGLPAGERSCPECGADIAQGARWRLRLIDAGAALVIWGVALTGVVQLVSPGEGWSIWQVRLITGFMLAAGLLVLLHAAPTERWIRGVGTTVVCAAAIALAHHATDRLVLGPPWAWLSTLRDWLWMGFPIAFAFGSSLALHLLGLVLTRAQLPGPAGRVHRIGLLAMIALPLGMTIHALLAAVLQRMFDTATTRQFPTPTTVFGTPDMPVWFFPIGQANWLLMHLCVIATCLVAAGAVVAGLLVRRMLRDRLAA